MNVDCQLSIDDKMMLTLPLFNLEEGFVKHGVIHWNRILLRRILGEIQIT